ncbi:MAG: primosomal protein N' [Acidobacteria bacterium]|nr:primosomal protein N' [Acidobacteriota bacterium]
MSPKVTANSVLYCDVSLPVPLDQTFTYELPLTLRHRVRPGSRLLVPFGPRKLSGIVLRTHSDTPGTPLREALRLLDEEPVLDEAMIALGRWIAGYYCAPLGDVLRAMTPLSGETRQTRVWELTGAGRDIAHQLSLGGDNPEDNASELLRLLDGRPLSEGYLKKRFPNATRLLAALAKKGYIRRDEDQQLRDPLRAASERLQVEFLTRPESLAAPPKLPKVERELLAYLELHPGIHNLAALESTIAKASPAARSLARRGLVTVKLQSTVRAEVTERPQWTLNPAQQTAFEAIRDSVASRAFGVFLLHGVTGSGKTEVYLRSFEAALAAGRSALLLVPEIALTPAVAGQFSHRFGDRVAILHSAFSETERAEQWRKIRHGGAQVVVGTRSGIFAPVENLGLVVIDEEHDGSYKQEENPRYNGRDVAIIRARAAGATVVLGSATPSLESRYNVERGKYRLLELPDRIEQRPMPVVELVDMRVEFLETRQQKVFSRRMVEEVQRRLDQKEQVMLLLNRRGFSNFATCRSCGERLECANCAVTLTYHRRDRRMLCHYCSHAERVPSVCPKCQSDHIHFVGTGSEKVEEELHREFPTARVARLDRDTVTGKRHFEAILGGFREGSFDILVGTQMIAKGHDIPNVTLVGIVSADIGLGMPDFRAAERTFQLLTQAAGRAGRGQLAGHVLLQTVNPDHYAVRFASMQDYRLFYEKEIQFRRLMRYPPFAALANVIVRHENQEDAMRMAGELAHLLTPAPEGIKTVGPAEAPVPRLKKEFRYQLLIKAINRKTLAGLLVSLRRYALEHKWGATALVLDVDPMSLL